VEQDASAAIEALLELRAAGATICPSEVARALAGRSEDGSQLEWRGLMPDVHAAVDDLAEVGRVTLSWKGRSLAGRAGPYRIGRPAKPDRYIVDF